MTLMKSSHLFVVFAVLLLFSSLNEAYCQDYIGYRIQINSDSSASWTITQVSDVNATVDSWEGFQQRVFTLVDSAINATNRDMAIEPETIQMETVIAWETQSKTTEFRFKWLDFGRFEGSNLVVGDVFYVQSLFSQLYGDGALQIMYPAGYRVVSLSPTSNNQVNDSRTLEWHRTQDFLNGKPSMTFASDSSSSGGGGWVPYVVLGLAFAVVAAAVLVGFYAARRRRLRVLLSGSSPVGRSELVSDEEKVMGFIRSSGGSVHQSRIVEQFGFSKAKTSQLLTSLEKKGAVARYKRGRDKIVNLIERTAGDKS
jgi:uncharacterized membrane protein